MQLHIGQLITAPFLPAAAEVKQFQARTGYYRLEVVLQDGHHTYQSLNFTDDQLAAEIEALTYDIQIEIPL